MQYTALCLPRSTPHVIVVSNEKGDSGKTTLAMRVAMDGIDASDSDVGPSVH